MLEAHQRRRQRPLRIGHSKQHMNQVAGNQLLISMCHFFFLFVAEPGSRTLSPHFGARPQTPSELEDPIQVGR